MVIRDKIKEDDQYKTVYLFEAIVIPRSEEGKDCRDGGPAIGEGRPGQVQGRELLDVE